MDRWKRWLIAAGVVVAAVTAVAVLAARRHVDTVRFSQPIERVEVRSNKGDVRVAGSKLAGVKLTRSRHGLVGGAKVEARVDGRVLRVTASCPRYDVSCLVNHRLRVPPGVLVIVRTRTGAVSGSRLRAGLDVRTRDGGIFVNDVWGDMRLRTYRGEIRLRNAQGALEARTHVGVVGLSSVAADATIRTTRGDVYLDDVSGRADVVVDEEGDLVANRLAVLDLTGSMGAGVVDVKLIEPALRVAISTDTGGISLAVPPGGYAVQATAASGEVSLDGVRDDPAAASEITARAEAGDVRLRVKVPA